MTLYLTFEEYTDLSGLITDEQTYTKVARKAQHTLDYYTFNRIKLLPEIPDVVKDTMADYVDTVFKTLYAETSDGNAEPVDANISSYSNSVEKITYKVSSEADKSKELNSVLSDIAQKYLPDYLLARGVNFDVERYLQANIQSENNNPQ